VRGATTRSTLLHIAAQHPFRTRPAGYRQSGPRQRGAVLRFLARRSRRRAPSPPRRVHSLARVALLAFIPGAIGLTTARKRLRMPSPAVLPLASAVPLAVAAVTPPSKWRYVTTGCAYMWVFKVTWELPFDDPEKLESRLRVDYPVKVDTVLGAGVPPGLRLQRAFRTPGQVGVLDWVAAAAYCSWFVPHLVMGWVWLNHERFVPRAAGRLAAAYHLTTPFYWAVPTAPPWWASEERGEMDGGVERVLRQVKDDLERRAGLGTEREHKPSGSPGNPWGSMPSDHIASAAITAMGLSEVGRLPGALGWAYLGAAGFSVVYLGEHYLVDVLAGLLVAEAIRLAEPLVNPALRRVARELERVAATAK
jgi:membrane-associated phospholipid phosphatase